MIDDMQPTSIDLDMIANCLRQAARNASNEEELRIHATRCIEDHILKSLGISSYSTKHEYTLISGARVDSLYGHVVIEYKAPGRLSQASEIAKAKEQVIMYIKELEPNKQGWGRYLGIIISDRLAFVRYYDREDRWLLRGAYELSRESVVKLVEAIRGLKRKSLNADNLLSDFGAESNIARDMVKTLYSKLLASKGSGKVALLYNEWARLFKQATGYDVEKLKGLEKEYGIKAVSGNGKSSVDYDALLFSIHTYYALLMKVLAAEMVYLYGMKFLKSFVLDLNDAYMSRSVEGLKFELEKLEKGEIFRNLLALDNFLEGDYFSWYLEVMDDQLASDIANMLRKLDEYELATPQLEPEFARDLLKRLYQHLLPRNIRHQLGEYYTPDWLAEFLLDEVGLSLQRLEEIGKSNSFKPLEIRVLDPACGSGTFLVAYIKRLRMYAEEHYLHDVVGEYILRNVVGYDLNPLAVLASRTNYLLSIADLLHYIKGRREIPVYLADSLMIEQRGSMQGINYVIKTSIGEFQIPVSIVNNGKLTDLLNEVILCMSKGYTDEEFRLMINHITSNDNEVETLCAFYRMLIDLKRNKRDDIWIGIIRNAFAPLLKGEFDYVVGNPPWINWENLSETIRPYIKELYKNYNILPSNPNAQTKMDISMIFVYRCIDKYLKHGRYLGFLINDAVFKALAANRFRKFVIQINNGSKKIPFSIKIIHDLIEVRPFEEAVNRTSMFIAKKGEATEFPIKYIKWRCNNTQIQQNMRLEEVLRLTERSELFAEPLGGYRDGEEILPFITLPNKELFDKLNTVISRSAYTAHAGCDLYPAAIYRVKIEQQIDDNLVIVKNLIDRSHKVKVNEIQCVIEKEFLYPVLESSSVSKWEITSYVYGIIPHENNGNVKTERILKIKYPKTYDYFLKFRKELEARSDYKSYGKAKPFWFVYKFAKHTTSPFKVVWNSMGNELKAAVVIPIKDKYTRDKPLIPEHVIAFIVTENEDEAHYLCAILNSSLINFILQSIAKGGKNFATPTMIDMINIRKYDPANSKHAKLVELSKRAHDAKSKRDYPKLKEIEKEIDITVANMYNISEEELLAILSGSKKEEMDEENIEEIHHVSIQPINTTLNSNNVLEFYITNPDREEITLTVTVADIVKEISVRDDGPVRIDIQGIPQGIHKARLRYMHRGKVYEQEFTLDVKSKEDNNIPKRKRTLRIDDL